MSAVYTLHDWFPGGFYQPRLTRFDNPFASVGFPHDALPFTGYWGVVHQRGKHIQADWIRPAQHHTSA